MGATATPGVVERVQYLAFSLAGQDLALDIARVRGIVPYREVKVLAVAPSWLRGVAQVHGQAVPVVDLADKFGRGQLTPTPASSIISVEARLGREPIVMGIAADDVSQVVDLDVAGLAPPPAFGVGIRVDYLIGFAKDRGKLTLLVDIDKLLTTHETLQMADAVASFLKASPSQT
jgi:purine-binding chemotaxis protein CheW